MCNTWDNAVYGHWNPQKNDEDLQINNSVGRVTSNLRVVDRSREDAGILLTVFVSLETKVWKNLNVFVALRWRYKCRRRFLCILLVLLEIFCNFVVLS